MKGRSKGQPAEQINFIVNIFFFVCHREEIVLICNCIPLFIGNGNYVGITVFSSSRFKSMTVKKSVGPGGWGTTSLKVVGLHS